MGRLFWKFFFFFWLAQLVTSIGVGVAIWLTRSEPGPKPGEIYDQRSPPPAGDLAGRDRPPPPPHHSEGRLPPKPLLKFPLLPLAAGSVVSLLFAALLAWYFARPIRSLRQAFESVAGGKLETRVGDVMGRRKDELADLGSDFDHMADRLQNLLDSQRKLLHDVSHEVRSPLARLQAAVDLMRQQPERAAELGERIERDTKRIDKLVGELLALARLDAGMTGKLDEEVDMHGILSLVAEDADFEAGSKACSVALDIEDPLIVRGNYDLIYRAIENVVRNAVRHSPQGGRITISAQPDEMIRKVRISIADEGAGVAEENLNAIFEPFFRESDAKVDDGYGLGLAITRRIVDALGGTISASNRKYGGLFIEIVLPQINPDAAK